MRDPIDESRDHYRRLFRRFAVYGGLLLALFYAVGVPHVQGRYTYPASHARGTTDNKMEADYWGPFGKVHLDNGEISDGLPLIQFIPLRRCFPENALIGRLSFRSRSNEENFRG